MPEVKALDRYRLKSEDYERIVVQCTALTSCIRHDVHGELGKAAGYSGIIAVKAREASTSVTPAELEFIVSCTEKVRAAVSQITKYLDTVQPRAGFSVRPFVSDVAAGVAGEATDGTVSLDPLSSVQLRVLFPEPTLYVMLRELVRNAIRHGGAAAAISWSMDGSHLVLSVHDAGTTLRPSLPTDFKVLSLATERGSGLQLLQQMLAAFSGLLVARQSGLMHGAEIALRFPIPAHAFEDRP